MSARSGVRVQLLRDHDLRLSEYWIPECDIDTERLCVDLTRESALGAKPKPVVLHPVVLNLRLINGDASKETTEDQQLSLAGEVGAAVDQLLADRTPPRAVWGT